jgi:hypothetical protein
MSQAVARRDALHLRLMETRERWEVMRAVVDITHAAMEAEGSDTTHESATTVLFRCVLEPMWQEIRDLDKLIDETRAESASEPAPD